MDTRLPYFDGQKDLLSYIRFLDNRKEFDGYMKVLDKKIAEFAKACALYGKAKEIEKKHLEAELWAKRAEAEFAEREEKLKTDEAAFKKTVTDKTAALTETESVMQQRNNAKGKTLREREVAVQEREKAIGEREGMASRKYEEALKAQQTSKKAKQEADALAERMRASMVPEPA